MVTYPSARPKFNSYIFVCEKWIEIVWLWTRHLRWPSTYDFRFLHWETGKNSKGQSGLALNEFPLYSHWCDLSPVWVDMFNLVTEGFATSFTPIYFFTCVNSMMNFQMTGFRKAFAALWTSVWFLPCVSPHDRPGLSCRWRISHVLSIYMWPTPLIDVIIDR